MKNKADLNDNHDFFEFEFRKFYLVFAKLSQRDREENFQFKILYFIEENLKYSKNSNPIRDILCEETNRFNLQSKCAKVI